MLRKKLYKILCLLLMIFGVPSICVDASSSYGSIENFVSRTYEIFLERDVKDDVGIDYWSYLIRNHEKSLYDYMISFLSGDEFRSREISDEKFLDMIYELLFIRNIGDDEKVYWMGRLSDETQRLGSVSNARLEIAKMIFNEPGLREISDDLGVTFDFENLNNLGVSEIRKDYSSSKIQYVNDFYKGFAELGKDLYTKSGKLENRSQAIDYIYDVLPIFVYDSDDNQYEELLSVSDGNVERIVHSIDYDIKFPYDVDKSVYISTFLQMNEGENLDFVTLGLGITSKGFEKDITKAELILGDELVELDLKYTDDSRYDSDKVSLHEFEFGIQSIDELLLVDKILSSDLSKLRFVFGDSSTYIYNLYEKDRVRNTLRFMWSIYSQIIISYLFESKGIFDKIVVNNLE